MTLRSSVYYTKMMIETYCFISLTSNATLFLPIHLLQNTADQQNKLLSGHTLPVQSNFQLTSYKCNHTSQYTVLAFYTDWLLLYTKDTVRHTHPSLYYTKIIRTYIRVISMALQEILSVSH